MAAVGLDVLPVAEQVGLRLALPPDDPPVDAPLGGAARICCSPAGIAEGHRRSNGSSARGLIGYRQGALDALGVD